MAARRRDIDGRVARRPGRGLDVERVLVAPRDVQLDEPVVRAGDVVSISAMFCTVVLLTAPNVPPIQASAQFPPLKAPSGKMLSCPCSLV
jgi:hypothetical protein